MFYAERETFKDIPAGPLMLSSPSIHCFCITLLLSVQYQCCAFSFCMPIAAYTPAYTPAYASTTNTVCRLCMVLPFVPFPARTLISARLSLHSYRWVEVITVLITAIVVSAESLKLRLAHTGRRGWPIYTANVLGYDVIRCGWVGVVLSPPGALHIPKPTQSVSSSSFSSLRSPLSTSTKHRQTHSAVMKKITRFYWWPGDETEICRP